MRYFTPYTRLVLFGKIVCGEIFCSMQKIKEAGFDGVQIMLSPEARMDPEKWVQKARQHGLETQWHILWSKENSPHTWISYPLSWGGYLLRDGYTFEEAVPQGLKRPVVVNGECWRETKEGSLYWLQTYGQIGSNKKFIVTYPQFVRVVQAKKLPVVFDTEHCLEFMTDVYGPYNLPRDPKELLNLLIRAWEDLGPYVKEIHFNDCDPRKEGLEGTKVFPGEGLLPLREFAQIVRNSGWNGDVSVEIMPKHHGKGRRLGKALAHVKSLLEG